MSTKKATFIISALLLSLGILGAGYTIGRGIKQVRNIMPSVTVKGLAEMNVKSDLGIWEIYYREVGNDLVLLDQRVQNDQQFVLEFLKQQGFKDNEIGRTQIKVEDRAANIYNQSTASQTSNEQRYVVTAGTHIRTTNVALIQKTAQVIDKLLQQGVPLAFDVSSLTPNPSYYFTQLDSIRPEMLAAATKSARVIGEQFAHDSNSHLGRIQHASQGLFQIMGGDTSTMNTDWNSNQNALGSVDKKVRLVTTIEYQIK